MAVLLLVDGSSYLYRAFHALPPLTNAHGEPTGAIYGVLNMLRRLLQDYKPDYVAVVFDAKGKTFRDALFADYKAQRPAMPTELAQQVTPLHTIIKAMGLPLLTIEGVEADDVIGTLAQQAAAQAVSTVISTGDKDFAQLVSAHITLINTMSNITYDRAQVVQKFGVPPELIVDYLSLIGDSIDNIPGIPGVGPKTAAKWLNEYGSLENLVANAATIKSKVGDNLRAFIPHLALNKQLVTIKHDVALPFAPQELVRRTPDPATLLEFYTRLEFKSWAAELAGPSAASPASTSALASPPAAKNYEIILTQPAFERWLATLTAAPLFAFDTETNSLDYMNAEIIGVSFAVASHAAAYVPLAHQYPGAPEQLDRATILQRLKPLLENPAQLKLGHNLKYDMHVLANHGIALQGCAHDSMLESYVINSTSSRHDMDTLALKHLNHQTTTFTDIAGRGAKQLTFDQIDIALGGNYAAEDADITWQLHAALWPQIAASSQLSQVYNDLEIPLLALLCRLERQGVLIDAALLAQQSQTLARRLLQLETQAYELAGQVFNLASPKQLQEILYGKQGLPVLEKTPTGQPSTSEAVLQELAYQFPLPKVILEHRSLSKLKSTYTDRLPQAINPRTGRVHTSYQQAAVATGRLSSSDPNLQNIPIRTEEGRRIRQAFIAPPGYRILAADYSQIELRIMAHMAQDAGLLQAFQQNLDVHRATAAEVFNVPLEAVTHEERRRAKAINFGLIYGMSAFGLAKQLGIDRKEAQDYITRYFKRYPQVQQYMETTRQAAHRTGYVETLLGRRLNLPEINSRNLQRQRAAERAAINAPLQGTAADIIKYAMLHVDRALRASALDAQMIMQVHDELVFEVAAAQVATATTLIRDGMARAFTLQVPLLVDIGVGDNWDEAHR